MLFTSFLAATLVVGILCVQQAKDLLVEFTGPIQHRQLVHSAILGIINIDWSSKLDSVAASADVITKYEHVDDKEFRLYLKLTPSQWTVLEIVRLLKDTLPPGDRTPEESARLMLNSLAPADPGLSERLLPVLAALSKVTWRHHDGVGIIKEGEAPSISLPFISTLTTQRLPAYLNDALSGLSEMIGTGTQRYPRHSQQEQDTYLRYSEMETYFRSLAATNPRLVRYEVIGRTLEGRDVFGVRIGAEGTVWRRATALRRHRRGSYSSTESTITRNYRRRWVDTLSSSANRSPEKQKPVIVLTALQHANEWATGAAATYITSQLVTSYNDAIGRDHPARRLLDQVDFLIVPCMNPDGYEHSWNVDRDWSKNRRPNPDGSFGVDLDRNWDTPEWGTNISSVESVIRPSSTRYSGPRAFSENEVYSLSQYIRKNVGRLAAYVDFHTHAQAITYPWANRTSSAPFVSKLENAGFIMARAARDLTGSVFAVKQASDSLPYRRSGSALDWFFGGSDGRGSESAITGVRPFAFIMDLGPANGSYEGWSPANLKDLEILNKDAYAAVVALALHALDKPLLD